MYTDGRKGDRRTTDNRRSEKFTWAKKTLTTFKNLRLKNHEAIFNETWHKASFGWLVCLFGVHRHTREFFTHKETSPLPVKTCKFWPMLGTHGHWAARVLWRAIPTVTRGIRLYWSSPRTRDTHTYCRASGSGAVTTCFYDLRLPRLGFKHPTFRLRGERSNLLRHRRGHLLAKYIQVCSKAGPRPFSW